MKILDLCKRVKELDSRYLEWDFYRSKWLKTGSDYFRKLANRAWASYSRLVALRNSTK